ncbi:MAG: 30S ribosomal protein S8 [Verrucomicrobia bacterium]|nr:30S ribosomal protein S8 [Verrucomicrobiota bacterium]
MDPIADMLSSICNAGRALKPGLELPYSKVKESIARILVKEGYIAGCEAEGAPIRRLKLKLKYVGKKPVITGLRRISTPGLRRYSGSTTIPRVLGGLGVAIVSTSSGVMTARDAKKQNVGGEVLCYVW